MKQHTELISSLFRAEFSRMVSVISHVFGLQHIEAAEDIVSDSFLLASENWEREGIPANPTAWLYRVAKQKAIQLFRRSSIYEKKVLPAIREDDTQPDFIDELDFGNQQIRDSQLQMIFAICDPAIASEAQIALALRILCGFSIDEIAEAFLTNKETVNKRLFRAKEKLRNEKISLEMPLAGEIESRLDNVLHVIYLLFNNGYYAPLENSALRRDLCLQAIHLGILLSEFEATNLPKTNALLALMCFHASRFEARQSADELSVLYDEQDRSLWNQELIDRGNYYLGMAATGTELSNYHLEAGIAFWHSQKEECREKWENILHHYDLLLAMQYSPIIALNRVYAILKARGREEALNQIGEFELAENHFYHVLLGELYQGANDQKAHEHYTQALGLAATSLEKKLISGKINSLQRRD